MRLPVHIAVAALRLRIQSQKSTNTLPAFSLVEMSIVIVIIATLVGATLAGMSLIKQARLTQDIKTLNSIQAAVSSFKDRYSAYPGNFANAYSYFGASCGANTSGATTSCNGSGNGYITGNTGSGVPIEDLLFWSHLNLSNILPGNYTGRISGTRTVFNTNAPSAAKVPGGFGAGYLTTGNSYSNPQANYIFYGAIVSATGIVGEGYLTPADASYVDTKIDDGSPGTGNVLGFNGASYAATCVNGTPAYITTNTSYACYLTMKLP